MKQLLSKLLRGVRKVRILRVIAIPLVTLVVGLGAGVWLGRASAPVSVRQSGQRDIRQVQDATDRETSRIESGYTYGKDRIAEDQKAKRLTVDQAKKAQAKLDELYKFRKGLLGKPTSESLAERSKMRTELRDWTKANDISSRYFIRLY